MALRSLASRFASSAPPRRLPARAFSSGGKVLSEEERAAESMFIKKMEKEKLEKAKQAATHEESNHGGSSKPSDSGSYSIPGPSKDSSKNFAVFAGVAGLLAVGWLFIRPSSKKEEEKN